MDQRLALVNFLRPRNGASMFNAHPKIQPVVRRQEEKQEITHFEKPLEELRDLLNQQDAEAKYFSEELCEGFYRVRCKIVKLNVIEDAFSDTKQEAMEKVATSLLRLFKNLFLQANYTHDSPDISESTHYLMKTVPSNRMRPIFLPDTDAKSCFNLLRQNTNDFLGKLVGFDIDDFQRSGGSHNPMFYLHGTLVFRTEVKYKGFRKKIPVFITEGAIGGNKKTTTNRAYARMLNKMVRLMKNLELENFDPTPENDPTLEIGMTEIVPALPAGGDEEEDEPKLTKKEWMALMNKSSDSSEPKAKEAKKIEESPRAPIIEAAMTEMGDSDLYSDIIEPTPDDFTLLSDDFPPLTPITKPTALNNANEQNEPIPAQKSLTKVKTPEPAYQAKEEKSDREKALEDKIDRLENLVLKLLEDKTKSKKKSKKRKEESSSSEASSEDSDL